MRALAVLARRHRTSLKKEEPWAAWCLLGGGFQRFVVIACSWIRTARSHEGDAEDGWERPAGFASSPDRKKRCGMVV